MGNFNVEYKLSGIIPCPYYNHYNTIIFNPLGTNIDNILLPILLIIMMGLKMKIESLN